MGNFFSNHYCNFVFFITPNIYILNTQFFLAICKYFIDCLSRHFLIYTLWIIKNNCTQ